MKNLVISLFIFLLIEPLIVIQDISIYVPGTDLIEKILLFAIFWTIGAILGALLFGYLLGPFFLFMHKNTIGRNMTYGIQDNPEPEKLRWMTKCIFPSLMAINFSLMFVLSVNILCEISAESPVNNPKTQ